MIGSGLFHQVTDTVGRILHTNAVATAFSHRLSELEHRAESAVPHSPSSAVAHEVAALGIHLAGVGLATVGSLTRLSGLSRLSRLADTVPVLVGTTANLPQIREWVRLAPGGEILLTTGETVLSVFTGAPAGPLVDAIHRLQRVNEARARQRVWDSRRRDLFTDDAAGPPEFDADVDAPDPLDTPVHLHVVTADEDRAGQIKESRIKESTPEASEPDAAGTRPAPLPPGKVERYASEAAAAGLIGGVTALVTSGPSLANAVLAAASAKPARLTKESFAARVGRAIAEEGTVVLDPRVFRRLDRMDTVVIEAGLLTTGRWVVDDVVLADGLAMLQRRNARINDRSAHYRANNQNTHQNNGSDREGESDSRLDPTLIHAVALSLLDPDDPTRIQQRDGWWLGPWSRRGGHGAPTAYHSARHRRVPGGKILALCRMEADGPGTPVAAITVAPELEPCAEAVVMAARDVGQVLVAGVTNRLDRRLPVGGSIPGGSRLAGQIRRLQASGHGVILLARHGNSALAAADCGIGVPTASAAVPHRVGHLVCGPSLATTVRILAAVPAARRAADTGILIAGYGAAATTVLGFVSGQRASRNASLASQVASLAGIMAGIYHADPVLRLRPPQPVDQRPWHALPAADVLRYLGSSPRGLPMEEAARRRERFHELTPHPGLGRAVVEEIANPLTPALSASAGLSAAIGSTVDAILIGGVLGVNALIGAVQRLGADRAVRRLTERVAVPVRLLRGGERIKVPIDELVPGDIIELRAGDAVPADCRLIEADGLELDEASLTGESLPVPKSAAPSTARELAERTSMVYDGTAVAAGHALAAVVAAGSNTEARRAARNAPRTQKLGVASRLTDLTRSSVPLSLGAGGVLLAANLVRGQSIGQALSPAISLAVASVPEGLPSVATVAQLAAARRLSQRGVLVRNPAALESLGRVQTLCCDKTGTLTEGALRLRLVSDGTDSADPDSLPPSLRLVLAAALRASPRRRSKGRRLPHPTDQAVVSGAAEVGVAVEEGRPGWTRVEELPFEPSRGYHAVLGTVPTAGSGTVSVLSVKGAPELVISRCIGRLLNGKTVPLTNADRRELTRAANRLAARGHRVLAVAESDITNGEGLCEKLVTRLRFVGFIALADRVRSTAPQAVATLRRAGVRIIMITGDHPSTAKSVADELGLTGRLISGTEIDRLDDDELKAVLDEVAVFARVTPTHKVRITRLLRDMGHVVAVTGDGANDAPAIRGADVGIALGTRATPAAREAADIVVTDDRIETIVDAVAEGRLLWASVREAVAVLVGGNLGEIGFTIAAGLFGVTALNTRQLLLINLLTDVLPALALAARRPLGLDPQTLLEEGPDISLGSALSRDIRIRAVATALAAGAAWLIARYTGTRTRASTVALVAMVSAQLGQTLVAGRFDPWVVGACVVSMAALATGVQTPVLSSLLGCRPLGPFGWGIALTAAAATTILAAVKPSTLEKFSDQLPSQVIQQLPDWIRPQGREAHGTSEAHGTPEAHASKSAVPEPVAAVSS